MTSGLDPAVAVLARSPLRVSLAGGGTDLPSYADRFGGRVLTLAIDRFVTVSLSPRSFDGAVDAAFEGSHAHGRAQDLQNLIARAALSGRNLSAGIQLSSFTDVPSGSGLGSSAAFGVALLGALAVAAGREVDPARLAEDAAALEQVELRRPVGKQDHYAAALGGLHLLEMGRDGRVTPTAVPLVPRTADYLRDRLLVFHLGGRRDAGAVLAAQSAGATSGDRATLDRLHAIRDLVGPMSDVVARGAVDDIGPLLDQHWQLKRGLSRGVTTSEVDDLLDRARAHGADGGRLLGAGGGGCLLLSVPAGRQDEVRSALTACGAREIPFAPSPDGVVTTMVPHTPRRDARA